VPVDKIEFHRTGVAGSEILIVLLVASFLTLLVTRLYTRLARVYGLPSGRVGDVHVHHMVAGNVLVLVCGMLGFTLSVSDTAKEFLAAGFGVGAAFILDEFALTLHLRDVYWTPEGRHSIEASLMWVLLGLLLLVGISPFGIHDQTAIPRTVGFVIVIVNIVFSVVTCLKGKLSLGLLSIFVPFMGPVGAVRLARPGSVWAQLFYRNDPAKIDRARARFDPAHSRLERARMRLADLIGGRHGAGPSERPTG
jgi:hypothetical protein